jgi:hypothetical protein
MLIVGPRNSCRESFKKLGILTVFCLYIYALMLLAVKYLNIYPTNSSVHGMNTRQQNKLHIPSVRLSSIQRCVYNSGFWWWCVSLKNTFLFFFLTFCIICSFEENAVFQKRSVSIPEWKVEEAPNWYGALEVSTWGCQGSVSEILFFYTIMQRLIFFSLMSL